MRAFAIRPSLNRIPGDGAQKYKTGIQNGLYTTSVCSNKWNTQYHGNNLNIMYMASSNRHRPSCGLCYYISFALINKPLDGFNFTMLAIGSGRTSEKTRKTAVTEENPTLPQIFLWDFQVNILPTTYRLFITQPLIVLDFDLSLSPKANSNSMVGVPIYNFLLSIFNRLTVAITPGFSCL